MPYSITQKEEAILANQYSCHQLFELSSSKTILRLAPDALERVKVCRTYLEKKLQVSGALHYGINTGFGALCNTKIESSNLEQLQYNLVRSHATGMGEEVPSEVVRLMLLLKVQSLSMGFSGVRPEVVQKLIEFLNKQITPIVYQLGSLGASGDLAPLAHISLALIGEGEVRDRQGTISKTSIVLAEEDIHPLKLHSKEGLALLNGTQFMTGYGTWLVTHAQRQWEWAQAIAALSCEAFLASSDPFNPSIHAIRPHLGQVESAKSIRAWRIDSGLMDTSDRVQDPYSFRCIPQVHGATWDVIRQAEHVFDIEINSATDNPNIFPDDDLILSGGNFHGQPLAFQLDFLAIALAELGSISERRTYLLVSGANQTNAFLAHNPGVESGLMIAQYTAASIVSANKQLCTPASIDSIPSSNGQEDHVSMGANAATKCYKVAENIYRLLAVELLTAYTALTPERKGLVASPLQRLLSAVEQVVQPSTGDRYLSPELRALETYLRHTPPPLSA